MSWVKLEKANDWGADYFGLPGKTLDRGFANARNAVSFEDGDKVHVRWADHIESEETVLNRQFSFTVGDMGHDYSGTYKLPGIDAKHNGTAFWLPLNEVEIWLEDSQ